MKKNKFLLTVIILFIFLHGCDTALEIPLSKKKVTLLSPANNLTTTDSVQTFFWEPVEGANKYELQIVSPNFNSISKLIADTIINTNRFKQELDKGFYQWRVKATNNSTSTAYSNPSNLIIE